MVAKGGDGETPRGEITEGEVCERDASATHGGDFAGDAQDLRSLEAPGPVVHGAFDEVVTVLELGGEVRAHRESPSGAT